MPETDSENRHDWKHDWSNIGGIRYKIASKNCGAGECGLQKVALAFFAKQLKLSVSLIVRKIKRKGDIQWK